MTKKEYLKPAMTVTEIGLNALIMAGSVNNVWTTGLGDDNLTSGGTGNSWNDAMSRRHRVWDENEEE